jgi:hypothetical protein
MALLLVIEMNGDLLRDWDRARGGQRTVIHAWAGDNVRDQADVGAGKVGLMQVGMQGEQIGFMHMGQDDILFMADTQFIMTIEFCQIGHGAHLIGAGVAGGLARRFQADAYNGMVAVAMGMGAGVYPCAKSRLAAIVLIIGLHKVSFEFWCGKSGSDCVQKSLIPVVETVPQQVKSGTHHGSNFFNTVLMYTSLTPKPEISGGR